MEEVLLAIRRIEEIVGASEASSLICKISLDIEVESRRLDEELASNNLTGVRKRLHALIGTLATFGFFDAAERARALHKHVSDPDAILLFRQSVRNVISGLHQASGRS